MKKFIVAVLMLIPSVAFAADTLGSQPVKTKNKNDMQTQVTGADGSTLLTVQTNNSAGSGNGAQVLPAIATTAAPSYSNSDVVALSTDTSGNLRVTFGGTSAVNITQVNGATLSATNPVFTQLTDGTSTYVGAKSNQLPTSLGQTTMAGSTSVTIASNQSTINVAQGAPTGAGTNRPNAVSIASTATSTITLIGSLTVSVPTKLYQVHITSQSPARCTIQYDNNGSITKMGDVMISASTPMATFACPAGFCAVTAGSTGTQAWEASCTNLDTITNDFVGDVQYCSSASGC